MPVENPIKKFTVKSKTPLNPKDFCRRLGSMLMEITIRENVLESDIANEMRVSRQWISQTFSIGIKTMNTLMRVADVLGYDVRVTLIKRSK